MTSPTLPALMLLFAALAGACASTQAPERVDVAGFEVVSPRADDDAWMADALWLDVADRMSGVAGFRAPATLTLEHRPRMRLPRVGERSQVLAEAAGDGVDALVFGQITRAGPSGIEILLELVDTRSGERRWNHVVKRGEAVDVARAVPAAIEALARATSVPLDDGARVALAHVTSAGASDYAAYGRLLAETRKDARWATPDEARDPYDTTVTDDEADALEERLTALAMRPGHPQPEASTLLGLVRGRLDESSADEALTGALEAAPGHVGARLLRGLLWAGAEPGRGEPDLAAVLARRPHDEALRTRLFEAWVGDAEQLIRDAGYDDDGATAYTRALAYIDEAVALIRPNDPPTHQARVAELRVTLLRALDRREEAWTALQAWHRALDRVPNTDTDDALHPLAIQRDLAEQMARAPREADDFALMVARDYPVTDAARAASIAAGEARWSARDCAGWTLLHVAADEGDVTLAVALLDAGAPTDPLDLRLETPLHRAAWRGHDEMVALLLARGADADARDGWGQSPVHLAVWAGHAAVLARLVTAGASPGARTVARWTPLHEAAHAGHAALVPALAGAPVDAGDDRGRTALFVAGERGDVVTLRALLELGANPNADPGAGSALFGAASGGDVQAMDLLLARGADPRYTTAAGTALHAAASAGHPHAVRKLLAVGLDRHARDADGNTALHAAAASTRPDTIPDLVRAGLDVEAENEAGERPLLVAARHGRAGAVRLLLAADADYTAGRDAGEGPLAVAARYGHTDAVRALAESLPTTQVRGEGMGLAEERLLAGLHAAVGAGQIVPIGVLVELGAPIDGVIADLSPLALAVREGRDEVVRAVLDAGADPGAAAPESGRTALHVAAEGQRPSIVAMLVEAGAPLDAMDAQGRVPLHSAIAALRDATLGALLEAGANPNVEWARVSPLTHAAAIDATWLAEPLIAAGATPDAFVAAWLGDEASVRAALRADRGFVRARDTAGLGALHYAVRRRNEKLAKLLLDRRAPVDLRTQPPDGAPALVTADQRPLHFAMANADADMASMLLARGADPWVADASGRTPLYYVNRLPAGARERLLARIPPPPVGTTGYGGGGRSCEEACSAGYECRRGRCVPVSTGAGEEGPEGGPDWLSLIEVEAHDELGFAMSSAPPVGRMPVRVRGGIQLRERWLEADALRWTKHFGEDDSASAAHGYERETTRCLEYERYVETARGWSDLLAIRVKWAGEGSLEAALARHNLGRIRHYQERYTEAEALLVEAVRRLDAAYADVATREAHFAGLSDALAAAKENLGHVYALRGDYAAAEPLYLEALALRDRRGGDMELVALSLGVLGTLYTEQGRYADAERALSRAVEVREELYGVAPVMAASDEGAPGLEVVTGGDGRVNVGIVAVEVFFQPAATLATAYSNLAVLYGILGEHDLARPLYERALVTLRKLAEKGTAVPADRMAAALHNVAQVRARDRQLDEALALEDEALATLEAAYVRHEMAGRLQLGKAALHREKGDLEAAASALEAGLAALVASHGPVHGFVSRAHMQMAELARERGDAAAASEHLQQALAIALQADAPEERWPAELAWGEHLAAQGETRLAIAFMKQAVNTIQGLRARLGALGAAVDASYLAERTRPYRALADALFEAGRLPEAMHALSLLEDEEFRAFATRSATGALARAAEKVELLASEQGWLSRYEEIKDNLVGMGREYLRLIEKRRTAGLDAADEARLAEIREALSVGKRAFASFLGDLRRDMSGMHALRVADIARRNLEALGSMQGTLKQLPAGAVLVHYLVTPTKLRILLTTPTVQVARATTIDAGKLNRAVADFRKVLERPDEDPVPMATQLYQIVLAPIVEDLKAAGATTLMVSLDGALRYVPLDALHDGERYMVERYRFAAFTDAAKPHLLAGRPSDWRVAALGLSSKHPGFQALPAVPAELAGVVKAFGGDRARDERLDAKFTGEAFRVMLEDGYPIVHIASHFVFRPGTERDSYLLLGDGQQLTLDAIQFDGFAFTDVSMLTLSACNTATGVHDEAAGTEVEGFAVMTQRMGARSVLASLWPVADTSTGLLMQRMYAFYRSDAEVTKAEALRRAKLTLLRGTATLADEDLEARGHLGGGDAGLDLPPLPGELGHPYYWAPFVLMGNWL